MMVQPVQYNQSFIEDRFVAIRLEEHDGFRRQIIHLRERVRKLRETTTPLSPQQEDVDLMWAAAGTIARLVVALEEQSVAKHEQEMQLVEIEDRHRQLHALQSETERKRMLAEARLERLSAAGQLRVGPPARPVLIWHYGDSNLADAIDRMPMPKE